MTDLNDSSVGLEAELLQAQRLNNELKMKLEQKDVQLKSIQDIHESEVRKLTNQVRNLSEQLEEMVKQKIEGDKRSQDLIEDLSLKNRDLNIELNKTIQKYQLEIQKQRGSFAKRSSVIAMAMLSKLSSPAVSADDKKPGQDDKPKDKNDGQKNPFKDAYLAGQEQKKKGGEAGHTNGKNKPIDEVPENSQSDDQSASAVSQDRSQNNPKDEELFRQISPTLPGLDIKTAGHAPGSNQAEILKIIEELQYMLKCEELEKKQIILEHAKTMERMAILEHTQTDYSRRFYALERDKVEALHQMDIYKTMAREYEDKWKDLVVKQSKIEVKLNQINTDKVLDQGEMELLKAENNNLKAKLGKMQLDLNEKEFAETENYQQYQEDKNKLLMQVQEKEQTALLMKNELLRLQQDKDELLGQAKDLEMKLHQANFEVAKTEEMQLQYTATIRELNKQVEKLSSELGLHRPGEGDIPDNVSDERLAFSERDSADGGVTAGHNFHQRSQSSMMRHSQDRQVGGSRRSNSLDNCNPIKIEEKSAKVASRANSLDKLVKQEVLSEETKSVQKVPERRRSPTKIEKLSTPIAAQFKKPEEEKPSLSKMTTTESFGQLVRLSSVKETTDLPIFSHKKPNPPPQVDNADKAPDSQPPSKREITSIQNSDHRVQKNRDTKDRKSSFRVGVDQAAHDALKKRLEELTGIAAKETEWERQKQDLEAQVQRLSDELNKRIDEVFGIKKNQRAADEELNRLKEDLRLKNLKIAQLETSLKDTEGGGDIQIKKLRDQLDDITQSLVEYKMRCNDLQAKADVEKARFNKQTKLMNFELDILRREIQKYNSMERED